MPYIHRHSLVFAADSELRGRPPLASPDVAEPDEREQAVGMWPQEHAPERRSLGSIALVPQTKAMPTATPMIRAIAVAKPRIARYLENSSRRRLLRLRYMLNVAVPTRVMGLMRMNTAHCQRVLIQRGLGLQVPSQFRNEGSLVVLLRLALLVFVA